MAAPFVAGVVALLRAANPSLSPQAIRGILEGTAVDFGPPGKDLDYGAGRLDGYRAISAARGLNTAVAVAPRHGAVAGEVSDQEVREYRLTVETTAYPIAATLLLTAGTGASQSGVDLTLLDASGQPLREATTDGRQAEIRYLPPRSGTYLLRLRSRAGQERFVLDVSGSQPIATVAD
jgi:serine protease AprX